MHSNNHIIEHRLILGSVCLMLLSTGACNMDSWFARRAEKPERNSSPASEEIERISRSLAVRGTVGEITQIQGLRKMRVRGYGLVVGLGKSGSRICPQRIRRRLVTEINKRIQLGDPRYGLEGLTADTIINSPDTAPVLVQGEIGAGALKGSHFDIIVQALAGTETTSLQGGQLYSCDLRYFTQVEPTLVQEGKPIAVGSGPVFILPESLVPKPSERNDAEPDMTNQLRLGRIIGGGTTLEDRRIHLILTSPSYAMAIRIQEVINDRFSRGTKIAVADSPSQVTVNIPRSHLGKELSFVNLLQHLYVSREAGFASQRSKQLADEILDPAAPHDRIALAWEALGMTNCKSILRNLYESPTPHVNYHAALSGLRLGDYLAIKPLRAHALDSDSPYQLQAIEEFGNAVDIPRVTETLREILAGEFEIPVRALAYESLLKHNDYSITPLNLNGPFKADLVTTSGKPFVYAKVFREPRMALIGEPKLKVPLFYRHPTGLLTLNARAEEKELTVLRRTPSGQVSPPTQIPVDAAELLRMLGNDAHVDRKGEIFGMGLSYPEALEVFSELCQSESLGAEFHMEALDWLYARMMPRHIGRPESEL